MMAVARFEMPDGRIGRFEIPDGLTPEQATALIQSQLSETKASTPSGETTIAGVASEIGKGLLRGPSDVAMMAGRAGVNMALGPFMGNLAAQGMERLAAPSRRAVSATPQSEAERFAGTLS